MCSRGGILFWKCSLGEEKIFQLKCNFLIISRVIEILKSAASDKTPTFPVSACTLPGGRGSGRWRSRVLGFFNLDLIDYFSVCLKWQFIIFRRKHAEGCQTQLGSPPWWKEIDGVHLENTLTTGQMSSLSCPGTRCYQYRLNRADPKWNFILNALWLKQFAGNMCLVKPIANGLHMQFLQCYTYSDVLGGNHTFITSVPLGLEVQTEMSTRLFLHLPHVSSPKHSTK